MEMMEDGEWESLRRMFSTEEADFAAQYLAHSHFPNGHDQGFSFGAPPASFWPIHEATDDVARLDENLFLLSHAATHSNFNHFSPECSYSSVLLPNPSYGNHYFGDSNHNVVTSTTIATSTAMDICVAGEKDNIALVPVLPACVSEDTVFVGEDMSNGKWGNLDGGQIAGTTALANELQLKRKSDLPELLRGGEEKIHSDLSESPKKKPRVSRDVSVHFDALARKCFFFSRCWKWVHSLVASDCNFTFQCRLKEARRTFNRERIRNPLQMATMKKMAMPEAKGRAPAVADQRMILMLPRR